MDDRKPGGQFGNKNNTKAKPWTDALNRALAQFADPLLKVEAGQALHCIAWETVKLALVGDKDARKEIGERMDGKVPLAIEGGVVNENFHYVISDRPKTADDWQRKHNGVGAAGRPPVSTH